MSKKKVIDNTVTYAVNGMMEYVLTVMIFGQYQQLHFTGGSMSGYGMRPATYTTDNEALQFFIENSDHFKSGKIIRLKKY